MNLFSQSKPKAEPEKIRAVKDWVYRILEVDSSISISISQLACREPGCPPIETVIAILSTPVQQHKIHKAVNDIDETDIFGLS